MHNLHNIHNMHYIPNMYNMPGFGLVLKWTRPNPPQKNPPPKNNV